MKVKSALIRLCAALMMTLLWAGVSPRVAEAGDGLDVVDVMPENAALVVVVDFEQLRQTPLFAELESSLHIHPTISQGYQRFAEHTGFDARRDLETLIVVLGEEFPDPGNYLIIGQGRFNQPLFVEFAQEQGANVTETHHNNHTIYEVDLDGGMVFHQDLFLTGNVSALKTALDNIEGAGSNLRSNDAMMALVSKADTRSSLWAVSHLSDKRRADLAASYPLVSELRSMVLGMRYQGQLDVDFQLQMVSERGAQSVHELLEELTILAAADDNLKTMGLEEVIRATHAQRQGASLSVDVTLDADEVERARVGLATLISRTREQFAR